MTVEQIRASKLMYQESFFLREIAAQLAEHNELLRELASQLIILNRGTVRVQSVDQS